MLCFSGSKFKTTNRWHGRKHWYWPCSSLNYGYVKKTGENKVSITNFQTNWTCIITYSTRRSRIRRLYGRRKSISSQSLQSIPVKTKVINRRSSSWSSWTKRPTTSKSKKQLGKTSRLEETTWKGITRKG